VTSLHSASLRLHDDHDAMFRYGVRSLSTVQPGPFEVFKMKLGAQLSKDQWHKLASLFPKELLPNVKKTAFQSGHDLLDWMVEATIISEHNLAYLRKWLPNPLVCATNLLPLLDDYESRVRSGKV
jgi:hypothetical protein